MRLPIEWQKSSFSEQGDNCIELALREDDILLRESTAPDAVIEITAGQLRAFIAGVQTRSWQL